MRLWPLAPVTPTQFESNAAPKKGPRKRCYGTVHAESHVHVRRKGLLPVSSRTASRNPLAKEAKFLHGSLYRSGRGDAAEARLRAVVVEWPEVGAGEMVNSVVHCSSDSSFLGWHS